MNVFRRFVLTSRASCNTWHCTRSTCLSLKLASAPSRAPVRRVNAINARSRFSVSVSVGIAAKTWAICSMVGRDHLAMGLGDPSIVLRETEIVGVGELEFRPIAGLVREPFEEGLQVPHRRVECRFTEFLAGPQAGLLGQPRSEGLGLLRMEGLEIAVSGISIEAAQRFVDRSSDASL